MQTFSSVQIEAELLESKRVLENILQAPVTNFAPPFGAINLHLLRLTKKYYQSGRTILPGLNQRHPVNRFLICAYVLFHHTSLTEIKSWLEQAVKEKKWLVLVYHHIDEREELLNIDAVTFENQLKLIQSYPLMLATMQGALNRQPKLRSPAPRPFD